MSADSTDFLDGFIGSWQGTVRTWLDPAGEPVVNDAAGTFRRILGRASVLHEYTSHCGESRSDGMMVIGRDIADNRYSVTWIDTFHTGGNLMVMPAGDGETAGGLTVGGSYAAGDQVWRWRLVLRAAGPDELRIEHFNISPDGQEDPAIEITYRRTSAG